MGGPARRTGRQNRTNGGCKPARLMATLTPMHAVCTGADIAGRWAAEPVAGQSQHPAIHSLTGWGHIRGVRLADVDE
jgi:hypothetical protein